MIFIYAMLSLVLAQSAGAATYDCTTEFGETVPIRKIVLRPGKACVDCEKPGAKIPSGVIDRAASKEWHAELEKDAKIKTKLKRKSFREGDQILFLDTRYVTRAGAPFVFDLNCAAEKQKCSGAFTKGEKDRLVIDAEPYDRRLTQNGGRAEIEIHDREHLGFIIRVFKDAVPVRDDFNLAVSAGGELKFYREDPFFIQDVGADEQLRLTPNLSTRIAALEVKVRCNRRERR